MICKKKKRRNYAIDIYHMLDSSLKWKVIGVLEQNSSILFLLLEDTLWNILCCYPHKPEDVSHSFAHLKSHPWVLAHPQTH